MKEITSKDNPDLKRIRQLESRKYREKYGQFLIEGPVALEEALKENAALSLVLCSRRFYEESRGAVLVKALEKAGVSVCLAGQGLFEGLSFVENPQGILAAVEKPRWKREDLFSPGQNLLVLDRIADPGNLGTMLRTCEAAGFGGAVCLKGTADPYNPKTARAAAGALLRLPLITMEGPEELKAFCEEKGKRLVCTGPRESLPYYRARLDRDVALVIGNEAGGVCRELMEGAWKRVSIPMEGRGESLNAAVAAAILMFEALRQKQQKQG